ncbi:MAG: hypothetical protein IT463_04045 [Planctomycetes bacterium]|nr:hypothetical protein [Planctomycetota bacterium]
MEEQELFRERQQQRDPASPTVNTVYLRVKSEQVKGLLGTKYAVPQGFIGLMQDKSGREQVMFPGEEAAGEFTVHLVRDREVRLPFNQLQAATSDGFSAGVSFELGVTPDVTRREQLSAFVERAAEGRRHLDWPLLKAELQPHISAAVKAALQQHTAAELADPTVLEGLREDVLDRCQNDLAAHGIAEAALELTRVRSDDFEQHQHRLAEAEQKLERNRAEKTVEAAMLRDQMGQELSRRELEEFLASAREEGLLKEHERKKADLGRQTELDKLEREYRQQQHSLEAALRKLVLEDKLDMDSLLLDKHIEVVKKLKQELSDDRIEVYINLIKDEKLKAELISRLIHRSMSPEQLAALAQIEAERTKQAELAISRPLLEPVRDSAHAESDTNKVKESDSVRVSAADSEATRREVAVEPEDEVAKAAARMNEALGTALQHPLETAPTTEPAQVEQEARTEPVEMVPAAELHEVKEAAEDARESDIAALALVVCGRRVFAIDPLRQRSLDDSVLTLNYHDGRLGSLRSARVAGEGRDRVLLAGARNGVYSTLLAHVRGNREFPIGPGVDARTGVNSAALYRGFIYATHSEFGLLRWPFLQPYSSAVQVMPELINRYSTTRGLQVFGGKLLFANGPTVLLLEAAGDTSSQLRVAARYKGTRHEVTALATDDRYIMVADAAGDVFVWDPESSETPALAFYAGTAISDLAAAPLGAGRRGLLVAMKRANAPMLFRDGSDAIEFAAPEGLRSVDVLNGVVVGVSRDRQRLFAWHEQRPEWPAWQFQFTEPVLDVRLVAPGVVARGPSTQSGPQSAVKTPPAY